MNKRKLLDDQGYHYMLFEDNGKLILETAVHAGVGSTAVCELNKEDTAAYKREGKEFLIARAEYMKSHPGEFKLISWR